MTVEHVYIRFVQTVLNNDITIAIKSHTKKKKIKTKK